MAYSIGTESAYGGVYPLGVAVIATEKSTQSQANTHQLNRYIEVKTYDA